MPVNRVEWPPFDSGDPKDATAWRLTVQWRIEKLLDRCDVSDSLATTYYEKIDRMQRADEIAEGVANKLRGERQLVFTTAQKIAGVIVFAILILDTVRSFLH